jgi:hypothetical protein
MTADAAVQAIRTLARARCFKWPMVMMDGVCIAAQDEWEAAVSIPGNLAELNAQLDAISAKVERHDNDYFVDAGDVDVHERAAASPYGDNHGAVPAPSPGDILLAVEGRWPVIALGRFQLHSEAAWRAALESATSDELLAIWRAIPDRHGDADRGN